MNQRTQFGMEIVALIQQHYPHALKGDAEQIAEASAVLATSLGGLLAFAYKFAGSDGATSAINLMIDKIIDNAAGIDAKAAEIIRTGVSRPVGH